MAEDLNRWQGIGRLGHDPEIRYTQDGRAVAHFSIACGRKWKNKQTGDTQEATEWVKCVAFGKLAEIIGEYVKKGRQIFCEGRLQTRKWQAQDGTDRYTTEIILDRMQMLSASRKESGHRKESVDAGGEFEDDEIPF